MTEEKSAMTACDRAFALAMREMGGFEKNPLIVVAFSGGSDSLALLLLLQKWCAQHQGKIIAVTIHHALRPQSIDEALWAQKFCQSQGIEHHLLSLDWEGAIPTTGIMQKARAKRYQALLAFCRAQGALHLALGHTENDQAETIAIRLEDQSGALGLRGMMATAYRHDARFIRPVLKMTRRDLQDYCRAKNVTWLSDPTNEKVEFSRVRHRLMLTPEDQQKYLSLATFYQKKYHDEADHFLREMVQHLALYPEGRAFIKRSFLAIKPQAQIFILRALLRTIAGAPYLPSEQKIAQLLAHMAKPNFKAATIHNVVVAHKMGTVDGFWCYPEIRTEITKNVFFQKDAGYGRISYPAKATQIPPYGYTEKAFFAPLIPFGG